MESIINLCAWIMLISFLAGTIALIIFIIRSINKYFKKVAKNKIREAQNKNTNTKDQPEKINPIYITGIILLLLLSILTRSPMFAVMAALLFCFHKMDKNPKNTTQTPKIKDSSRNTNPQWEKVILPDGTEFYKLKRNGDFDIEQQKRMNELIEMQKLPYSKKNLLTPTEYRFWTELKSVCDAKNFLICPKVRMEDFIQVNVSAYAEKQKYRGKIKSRHIDFIICDNRLKLLAGIELDDKSHNQKAAQKNDEFKNQVFFNLRLPLYRVKVKSESYSGEIEQIMNDIAKT